MPKLCQCIFAPVLTPHPRPPLPFPLPSPPLPARKTDHRMTSAASAAATMDTGVSAEADVYPITLAPRATRAPFLDDDEDA